MSKLYELVDDALDFQRAIEGNDEITQEMIDDTLESMGVDDKFAAVSAMVKNLRGEHAMLKDEISKLQKRAQAAANNADGLKEYAKDQMIRLGLNKAGNLLHGFVLSIPKKPSVVVQEDGADFPSEFISMVEKRDQAGLKSALKDGKEINGFSLKLAEPSLRIK